MTLREHLERVQFSALAEAERLLEQSGPEPDLSTVALAEVYLNDADRASRLLALDRRTNPSRAHTQKGK